MNRRQGQFLNLSINLILGVVMSATVCVILGTATWDAILLSTLLSVVIGYTVGDLVPIVPAGDALGAKIGRGPVVAYLVSTALLTVVMATTISALSVAISLGLTAQAAAAWWSTYPLVVAAAYVVLLLVRGPLTVLAVRLFGTDVGEPRRGGPEQGPVSGVQ